MREVGFILDRNFLLGSLLFRMSDEGFLKPKVEVSRRSTW